MLVAAVLLALLGLVFFLRSRPTKAKRALEGDLPTALEAWVADALARELRAVAGLNGEAARAKLKATLAGEPDPDVVSAVAEAVHKVDLEYTRLDYESDAELAVVVRYEDGRVGRVTRRLPLTELPTDVHQELTSRAVTRVFRAWQFSWDR